ncbi:MAG: kelch repeat-containing protein [Calditrichia bacterium]
MEDKMQNLQRCFLTFFILLGFSSLFGQQWQYKTPMPTARKGMAAAVLDHKIWVMGGRKMGPAVLNTVEVYDPAADSWENEVPQLLHARENASAQVWENKIYIFGGAAGNQPVSEVECYDPEKESWEVITHMPTPRFGMASVMVDSSIWLIGGADSPVTFSKVIEIYHPRENSWETLPAQLNTPRGDPMAAVLMNRVFVFGGHFYGPIASVEFYSLLAQNWIELGNMPVHCGSAGYTRVDDRVLLIGGLGPNGILPNMQIFRFSLEKPEWSQGPALNTPRRELAVDDKIYAIGGSEAPGGMSGTAVYDVVEELDALVGIEPPVRQNPESYALLGNYPNPFNSGTVIRLQIPAEDKIQLKVYDILGREVALLYRGSITPGAYTFPFSGTNSAGAELPSAVYFVRLEGQKYFQTHKIFLMR